jgi:RecB family endonuclease NucS
MSSGDVEVYYYSLYNAILLGNSQDAKMYLEFLRDEFTIDEKSFDVLKVDERWDHLRQLSTAIENGLTVKNFNYKDDNVDAPNKDDEQVALESDLVKIICKESDSLKQLFGATDQFFISNLEHPTRYGKVDIIAKDGLTTYVIEVKKSHARFSVISQIEKYLLDFKLKLILKQWKTIVGVVIANGYIDGVARELVKLGVIPIKYKYKHNVLRLRKCRKGE